MIREDATLAVPVSAHDHVQGNAHAAVTLVEYRDFQCPACGMAYPLTAADALPGKLQELLPQLERCTPTSRNSRPSICERPATR